MEILDEANSKALIKRLTVISEQLTLAPSLSSYARTAVGFLGLDPHTLPPFLRTPPPSVSLALVLTDVSLPVGM